jgi:uncharacterized protein YeeX (DUF496 family)
MRVWVGWKKRKLKHEEIRKQDKIEIARKLMDILDNETIALKTGLSVEEVAKIRVKETICR